MSDSIGVPISATAAIARMAGPGPSKPASESVSELVVPSLGDPPWTTRRLWTREFPSLLSAGIHCGRCLCLYREQLKRVPTLFVRPL